MTCHHWACCHNSQDTIAADNLYQLLSQTAGYVVKVNIKNTRVYYAIGFSTPHIRNLVTSSDKLLYTTCFFAVRNKNCGLVYLGTGRVSVRARGERQPRHRGPSLLPIRPWSQHRCRPSQTHRGGPIHLQLSRQTH